MTDPGPLRTNQSRESFLADYTAVVQPLSRTHAQAYWDFSTTGDSTHQNTIEHTEQSLSDFHSDPRVYEALIDWSSSPTGDAQIDRQIALLVPQYRQAQVPAELRSELIRVALKIEETFTVFRPRLGTRQVDSNELDRILQSETDQALRKEAWEATRAVGDRVAHRVVELAKLRNQQAQLLGFENYYELALDDEELTPTFIDELIDELCTQSQPAWLAAKALIDDEHASRLSKPVAELMPWDYGDRFFQSVPRNEGASSTDSWFPPQAIKRHSKEFFASVGLPITSLWTVSDMFPRDGKYPNAFCIGIDNPQDVRVLCNLDATSRWMETTLHEFGHALYNTHINPELPWLLRESAHTFVTEAVAMFFGRLPRQQEWLTSVVGVPEERAELAAQNLREAQLVFCRWACVVNRFERSMYQDPNADLTARWWELVSSIQGLTPPSELSHADWAAKVHIACYPVYYQNYLLGEILASQFSTVLREQGIDSVSDPRIGPFFTALFELGRSLPWAETVTAHTGRPLSTEHWFGQFAS